MCVCLLVLYDYVDFGRSFSWQGSLSESHGHVPQHSRTNLVGAVFINKHVAFYADVVRGIQYFCEQLSVKFGLVFEKYTTQTSYFNFSNFM